MSVICTYLSNKSKARGPSHDRDRSFAYISYVMRIVPVSPSVHTNHPTCYWLKHRVLFFGAGTLRLCRVTRLSSEVVGA